MNKSGKTYLQHCSELCKNTHNSIKGSEKRKQTCMDRYGSTSNLTHPVTQKKIKTTMIEKYGVDHPMKNPDIKQKLGDTKNERFGDPAYNNREKFIDTRNNWSDEKLQQIHDKKKATNRERYGVDYSTQSTEMVEKTKITNLARYGVVNAASAPETKQKIRDTMVSKYGKHINQIHISDESLQKLNDYQYLEDNKCRRLKEIADELGVTYYTVSDAYTKMNIIRTPEINKQSLAECEIADYIRTFGVVVDQNNRSILHRKEIDIYLPEFKMGIEYHGLYWHSEGTGTPKNYHRDKLDECDKQGLALIQITDYEWINKQELVKSRIAAKLGKSNRVYARKCKVGIPTLGEERQFLTRTHIQGHVMSSVKLGLYHDNKLIALMTFGKSRYNRNAEWELLRYSNDIGIVVVGGAGKLFNHFLKMYKPRSVISYCDLRWNSGNMYQSIGFTHEKTTKPNYWYTKHYTTMESRIRYQKHKLSELLPIFDNSLTEWENMKINGYDRFWDCGNSVYMWKDKNNA
jgi:hypothetical protein